MAESTTRAGLGSRAELATESPSIPPADGGRGERANAGRVRWAVLMWALGVPLPLVLLFLLFRGCA